MKQNETKPNRRRNCARFKTTKEQSSKTEQNKPVPEAVQNNNKTQESNLANETEWNNKIKARSKKCAKPRKGSSYNFFGRKRRVSIRFSLQVSPKKMRENLISRRKITKKKHISAAQNARKM